MTKRLDEVLENRLAISSLRTVKAALGHWDQCREAHGWERLVLTDDPIRGAKMATLVLYLIDNTNLVYASVVGYVWAVRTYMKYQRQLDPVMGVANWSDLMQATEVLTFMPAESRKQVPGSWINGAVDGADRGNFNDVRAVLLMLLLLFTFARSESPLAKTKDGKENFDVEKQLCLRDVRILKVQGMSTAQFRLKGIKQDTLGQLRATEIG